MNLKWFMDTKSLNYRQVRSYLVLSQYDFTLTHRPGSTNPADGPLRRPDYMAEAKKPSQKNNEVFVSAMKDLLSGNRESSLQIGAVLTRKMRLDELPRKQRRALQDFRRAEERAWKEPQPVEDDSDMESDSESDSEDLEPGTTQNDPEWPTPAEDGFIWLTTTEQKSRALQECHDSPLAGHFGKRRTLEKVQRRYKWKGMAEDVS